MKFLLVLLGVTCWSLTSFGQSKIIGRIKDQQGYLPFANVTLRLDSVVVKALTTDSLGSFAFEKVAPGRYWVSASMVGYAPYSSSSIVIGASEVIVVPEIVLNEVSLTLQEIEVTAEKQWTDQQADRMVINLEGSITAAGNSILEVLQKSPGVVVNKQSGTIAINGKPGVRIMINEKLIQVSSDVAMQMLEGMNASNIEKIELIITPPASYDADGSGGIIHIVTKEKEQYGTNGSVAFTLGAHWAETLGAAVSLNHRNKKAAYFLDYSLFRNHNLHKVSMQRRVLIYGGQQTVLDTSRRENNTTQQNLSAGAEWNLSENTLLKILVTGYKRNWELDASAHNYSISPDTKTETWMNVTESNVWQSATGSIGLQRKVNAKDNIDLAFDYLYYYNNNPSDYDDITPEDADIALSKNTPIHIFVGKADYRSNLSRLFSWEAGVKAVASSLNNYVTVRQFQNGEWTTDPTFTSRSTLHERVVAGYVSTQWQTENQWQIIGGLRYEYTRTSISSETSTNRLQREYGYLFPTVSIKKKFSSKTELLFAYSRRLTRPTYNDIAPYVFFWGPNSFSAGNTSLYPALSDGVSIGYNLWPWTVSLQYTHTENEIATMQPEIDNVGNLIYRSQNLKYLNTFALSSSYSFLIASWWEIQSTIVAQYQKAKTLHRSDNNFHLYGINVNIMNMLKLPKDFSIEISGIYQSRSLSGISYFLPIGSLNAGVQKKLGQHGALKLSIDDIFYTNAWKIKTLSADNNLDVYFHYDWYNRFVRLTYTWNIGDNKLRSVKLKSASEEERQRVNN